MLAVQPHDASVVNHLDEDQHRVRRLHDLVVVVVQQRDHRRARARTERQDAALAERAHLRPVRSAAAAAAAAERHALRHALLAGVSQRRHAAVRRIDEHRAASLAVDRDQLRARVDPEIVVAAIRAAEAAAATRRQVLDLGLRIGRRIGGGVEGRFGMLQLIRFLRGEHQPLGIFLRPLEGRDRGVGPVALQVRMTVGRAWRTPLAGGRGSVRGSRSSKHHRARDQRGAQS